MYNLANPWEMQDFVEDFVFTAGHVEVMRFTRYADTCIAVLTPSTRTHVYSSVTCGGDVFHLRHVRDGTLKASCIKGLMHE
jgi:hypothetical protein